MIRPCSGPASGTARSRAGMPSARTNISSISSFVRSATVIKSRLRKFLALVSGYRTGSACARARCYRYPVETVRFLQQHVDPFGGLHMDIFADDVGSDRQLAAAAVD